MSEYEENIDVGVFLNLLERFPHIYNLKDKNNKNIFMKENSWSEIAHAMNATVEDCKRLWKNLRDRYTREKRQRPSRSGVDACDSRWEFFDYMLFYDPCIVRRRAISSTKRVFKKEQIENDSCSLKETTPMLWNATYSSQTSDDINEPSTSTQENSRTSEGVGENNTQQGNRNTITNKTNTGRKTPKDSEFSEIIDIARTIASKITGTNGRNQSFAHYVELSLNEMDEQEAKEKRRKIVSILES